MSVTIRAYRRSGWEAHIRLRLPDGRRYRERSRTPGTSRSAARRWAEERERHLLLHGPGPERLVVKEVPTLETFAPRFVDGHTRANRHKPSGLAGTESMLKWHLLPAFGAMRLDAITNEHVQKLKLARLGEIVALEWGDVDLRERRLTVQRSDWCGHVTVPKGGRSRCLPMTQRLTEALKSARHLRSPRVLCLSDGTPYTRDRVIKGIRWAQRLAGLPQAGVHILRHTFCSHLAMKGAPARAYRTWPDTRICRRLSATCT